LLTNKPFRIPEQKNIDYILLIPEGKLKAYNALYRIGYKGSIPILVRIYILNLKELIA
jgi:hypothetical protein